MKAQLIYPMAFYVFYMWCLLVLNFKTRVKAIKAKELSVKYFKNYTGDEPSELVTVRGNHVNNQFQLPMVFFITCLAYVAMDQVNILAICLAWGFVVSRLIHSFIHLGTNNVIHRLRCYALGWFLILGLWVQLVLLNI